MSPRMSQIDGGPTSRLSSSNEFHPRGPRKKEVLGCLASRVLLSQRSINRIAKRSATVARRSTAMSRLKELREKRAAIHAQTVEELKKEQTPEIRQKVTAMFADID